MWIWGSSASVDIVKHLTGREQNLWHLILPSLVTSTLMKKDSVLGIAPICQPLSSSVKVDTESWTYIHPVLDLRSENWVCKLQCFRQLLSWSETQHTWRKEVRMLEKSHCGIHGRSVGFQIDVCFPVKLMWTGQRHALAHIPQGNVGGTTSPTSYQHVLTYGVSTFPVVNSSSPSFLPSQHHFVDYTPGLPLRSESCLAFFLAE